MAIGEGNETPLKKQSLVSEQTIEFGDPDCLCRLQTLVGELLIKNELLRHQLRQNDYTIARLHQLFKREETFSTTETDVISPSLQAYALLARQKSIPPPIVCVRFTTIRAYSAQTNQIRLYMQGKLNSYHRSTFCTCDTDNEPNTRGRKRSRWGGLIGMLSPLWAPLWAG
jgi:hypothetical protein